MKKVIVAMVVAALALLVQGSAASAQDYSGPGGGEGVFAADGTVTSGEAMTFAYSGLQPGAPATVKLKYPDGTYVTVATTTVSGSGAGSLGFSLPSDLPAGVFEVVVESTAVNGSAYFANTTFTLGQALGGGQGTLAITGAETPSLIGAAALLMMLGTGFVLVSRRKGGVEDADLLSLK